MTTDDPFLRNGVQPLKDYLAGLREKLKLIDKAEASKQGAMADFLGACLRTCQHAAADSEEGRHFRSEIEEEIKALGLKMGRDAHTATKVVTIALYKKNETQPDRRRKSELIKVLGKAIAQNVSPDGMKAFITKSGGISELMRSKSKKSDGETGKPEAGTAAKAAEAYGSLSKVAITTIQEAALTKGADPAFMDLPVVLLATQLANSKFVVHGVVRTTGPVDAAYAAKHKEVASSSGPQSANDAADVIEKALDEAVEDASA